MKKIIAVFKTHFDIGFTGLAEEVVQNYANKMLTDVLSACEGTRKNPEGLRFVWTMPSWPLLKTLELASPDKRERAERLIRDGQLVCHALPFTTHTEFLSVDELVHSLRYAKELCDRYGRPYPVSAKMTDVPGHTSFLPHLLSGAGVKFLHLGCNPASEPPDVPLLFWWESKCGGRVLTMYSKGSYGTGVLPPKDWKYPVWLAMQQTNDNMGPQGAAIIREIAASTKGKYALSVGSMDDFYNEIIKCDLSDLPVVQEDLADGWIHGIGSYPSEVAALRKNREKLKAYSVLAAQNEQTYAACRGEIIQAYDSAILFGEHTWGLDVKSTLGYGRRYDKQGFREDRNLPQYKRIEASWQEQRTRAKQTLIQTDALKARLSGKKDAVFNPNAQPFCGYIESADGSANIGGKKYSKIQTGPLTVTPLSMAVVPVDEIETGETKDYFLLRCAGGEVRVDKKSGYAVYYAIRGKNLIREAGRYVYETISAERMNEFMRGYLYRFYDWAINDFGRMNYPFDFEGKVYSPVLSAVRLENDSIVAEFVTNDESATEYGNAASIVNRYYLLGNTLHIDVSLKEKQASPVLEGGHLIFETLNARPKYVLNKTGAEIRPERDIRGGCNHSVYCIEKYVREEESGLVIGAESTPLLSFSLSKLFRHDKSYRAADGKILFNAFNNMWGTNFPQWTEGDLAYSFTLSNAPELQTRPVLCDAKFSYAGMNFSALVEDVFFENGKKLMLLRNPFDEELETQIAGAVQVDFFLREIGAFSGLLAPYETVLVQVEP